MEGVKIEAYRTNSPTARKYFSTVLLEKNKKIKTKVC